MLIYSWMIDVDSLLWVYYRDIDSFVDIREVGVKNFDF